MAASTLPDSLQAVLFSPAQKHEWRSGSWGGSAVGSVDPGCVPECRLHQRHKIKVALPALLSRLRREEAQVIKKKEAWRVVSRPQGSCRLYEIPVHRLNL